MDPLTQLCSWLESFGKAQDLCGLAGAGVQGLHEPYASGPMDAALNFGRELRLVHQRDFDRVYRQGARARGRQLLVVAAANQLPHPRLGLSVGRSIWKSAVRRNRIRRVFREAFRLECAQLPAGFDLILIPAQPRLVPQLSEVRRELVDLARRASQAKPRLRT